MPLPRPLDAIGKAWLARGGHRGRRRGRMQIGLEDLRRARRRKRWLRQDQEKTGGLDKPAVPERFERGVGVDNFGSDLVHTPFDERSRSGTVGDSSLDPALRFGGSPRTAFRWIPENCVSGGSRTASRRDALANDDQDAHNLTRRRRLMSQQLFQKRIGRRTFLGATAAGAAFAGGLIPSTAGAATKNRQKSGSSRL